MNTEKWIKQDKVYAWHPFTQQQGWCADQHDPLILIEGKGVWLWDSRGNQYIDGNASIWTNIHGHKHPVINKAIQTQLEQVSHTSYLGFSNPRASELAAKLVKSVKGENLQRVFFSDNGSTAVECALRMSLEYRQHIGEGQRTQIVAFENSYHGDTLGAASLSHVPEFFDRLGDKRFPVIRVNELAALESLPKEKTDQIAAVIIEPLIQGVNQMSVWREGLLRDLRQWCDTRGVHLVLDEVMTGFGRTGTLFAHEKEEVAPDFLCLAKGLTGGYLPMGATVTTKKVYQAFLGKVESEKTFFYGHSYTANPLACAAALANLQVFEEEATLEHLPPKIKLLAQHLDNLKKRCKWVYETRQCGMIAGIELRQKSGKPFNQSERRGDVVCLEARKYGLLTRPILDTLVFLPPLCINEEEMGVAFKAFELAIKTLGEK